MALDVFPSAWYGEANSLLGRALSHREMTISSTDSILREYALEAAFQDAIKFFKYELTHDQCKQIGIEDKNSIQDIVALLEDAKTKFEQKNKGSKAWVWLNKFSKRLLYYGAIMDTMGQPSFHPALIHTGADMSVPVAIATSPRVCLLRIESFKVRFRHPSPHPGNAILSKNDFRAS